MPESAPTAELEARLAADEARLARDEQRLLADEVRLDAEETEVRDNRIIAYLGVGLALVLGIAVAALVIGLIGLRHDVTSLSRSAPDASVGTAALRDGSVTADKLAAGAVETSAVARNAITRGRVAPGAVAGAQVARDSLTGADIREGSLATVPSARDARRLGGLRASVFLSQPFAVSVASLTDARAAKGPLSAICPSGSRVVSGGAAIEGAVTGAAVLSSAPAGERGWTATARVARHPRPAWRLVVTAICAAGGQ